MKGRRRAARDGGKEEGTRSDGRVGVAAASDVVSEQSAASTTMPCLVGDSSCAGLKVGTCIGADKLERGLHGKGKEGGSIGGRASHRRAILARVGSAALLAAIGSGLARGMLSVDSGGPQRRVSQSTACLPGLGGMQTPDRQR